MKKISSILDKYLDKLGLLLIALNLFSSLIVSGIVRMDSYGTIFNYTQFVLIFLYCIIFCLIRRDKENWKNPSFSCVLIFLFFSFITILLNPNKIINGKITVITFVQWFVIFLTVKNQKKSFLTFINILNYVMFLATFTSLYLYVANVQSGGRYAGIFANVNMGAILCCMAIGMSLILFQNANKIKKSFLLINIILQIMFIRLALSRAGIIVMWIILLTFVLLITLFYKRSFKIVIRNLFILVAVVLVIYNLTDFGLKFLRNSFVHTDVGTKEEVRVNENKNVNLPMNEDKTEKTEESKPIKVSERDEKQTNESNHFRLGMLKYGIETISDKPLLGQGVKNLPNAVMKNTRRELIGIFEGGVHNSYLELVISNGIIGFLSFAAIHVCIWISIWKRRKKIFAYTDKNKIIWFSSFFAVYIGLLIYGLFESILVMNSAFVTSMFALVSGGLLDE